MKIALLGYGVVGKGVVKILDDYVAAQKSIATAKTEDLELSKILLRPERLAEFCQSSDADSRFIDSFEELLQDPEIDCVVECIGGLDPAHEWILAALEAGKHVVTSNKAVVATYMDEFLAAAQKSGASLRVEACCAGGIPWIYNLTRVRRVEKISKIEGIVNGTSNYILDELERGVSASHPASFREVLKKAQELGYAEADPSSDIDGFDSAYKTKIAAAVAFGLSANVEVPTLGIRSVSSDDIAWLLERGLHLRLLSKTELKADKFAWSVEPTIVSADSVFTATKQNNNCVVLHSENLGALSLIGQGAGSLPTAHAVVQDVFDLASKNDDAALEKLVDLSSLKSQQSLAYTPQLMQKNYLVRTFLNKDDICACAQQLLESKTKFVSLNSNQFELNELSSQRFITSLLSSEFAHALVKELKVLDESSSLMAISDDCLDLIKECGAA